MGAEVKTFGETLSDYLLARGISKKELSRKAGLSSPYITQVTTGKIADPTFEKAWAIFDALGITSNEFRELQKRG